MYFLGTISGASGAYYNNVTGLSGVGAFSIPPNIKSVYLQPSHSGISFGFSIATGTTSFMNATNGARLVGPDTLCGPYRIISGAGMAAPTIGVYAPGATQYSVRIFGSPTS